MKTQASPKRNNEIDPTFGTNGKLSIVFPNALNTGLKGMKMNVTGVIFIYGTCKVSDSSFNYAPPHRPSASLFPLPELPVQPALASSHQEPIAPNVLVACRLTREGQLDKSFGVDGFATPPDELKQLGPNIDFNFLNNGNDFLLSGKDLLHAKPYLPLAHFTLSGKYTKTVRLSPFTNMGRGVLVVDEDKVLACYTSVIGQIMYRFNADGSPDESFGDEGWVNVLPEQPGASTLEHLASGLGISDQTIYVSGRLKNAPYVVRLKQSGERDSTFGKNGLYVLNEPTKDPFYAVTRTVPLSNGGVLILIVHRTDDYSQGTVIKLTAAGQLDSTFNNGTPLKPPEGFPTDMALQADGKFLVANVSPKDEDGEFAKNEIFRYLSNGQPDTSFGDNGVVTFKDNEYFLSGDALHVLVQPDGKIIVSGDAPTSRDGTILVRLMA